MDMVGKDWLATVGDAIEFEGDEREMMEDKGFQFIGSGMGSNVYRKGDKAVKIGKWLAGDDCRYVLYDGENIEEVLNTVTSYAHKVLEVYDWCPHSLTMEYVEGEMWMDCREQLDTDSFYEEMKKILKSWAQDGIVLDDVYDENVIVDEEGNWSFIDWGRVKFLSEEEIRTFNFDRYWEEIWLNLEGIE